MRARSSFSVALLAVLIGLPLSIGRTDDSAGDAERQIRAALERWTAAFNARDASGTCDLFAPDLIATYPGAPDRNRQSMCRQLAQAVTDPEQSLRYSFQIEEMLYGGDITVVRLVWTLRTKRRSSDKEETVRERGVDVFRRQSDGTWKILRSMAYPIPDTVDPTG